MTLSDTQFFILRQAAQHPDELVTPPQHLPPGPRAAVARALLNAAFVDRTEPSDPEAKGSWKLDGETIWLAITVAGRQAIDGPAEEQAASAAHEGEQAEEIATVPDMADASPPAEQPATDAAHGGAQAEGEATAPIEAPSSVEPPNTPPSPARRPKLRDTAAALLACWDATTEREPLADAVAALRAALGPVRPAVASTRGPRQGTKQEAVLALLRRPEGATIASVVAATGWAQHTVRGFFAHLKKKGHTVEVLERVRQVGAGSTGAKSSYSIYRLAEAG